MNALTGTWTLARMNLRRDRIILPLVIAFLALVPPVFVAAFTAGYPTQQALDEYAYTSTHTPAFAVTYGALTGSTLGEMVSWRLGFAPVILGLLAMLLMLRYTRGEEEAGRSELVMATGIGRYAGLSAAVATTGGAGIVLGLAMSVGLLASGLPTVGSWLVGLGMTGCWVTFTAVGAVLAQLSTRTGAARGLAVAVLTAAFLLRGIGDVSAQLGGPLGWISWLTPIGWGHLFRPYAADRWWVAVVPVLVTAALLILAVRLAGRRDLGVGLIHERPGAAEADPTLRSPLGLAWRLHRGTLLARAIGTTVVGVAMGSIAQSIGQIMNNSTPQAQEALARIGGAGVVVDQYLVGTMNLLAVVAAAFAIHGVLRLRVEERDGRAELLLASPVDRLAWAGGHLFLALLGSSAIVLTAGLGIGLAYGLTSGSLSADLGRVLAAAAVQLPVTWLLAGLTFAIVGWLPRLAVAGYLVTFVSLLFGWIAGELGLSSTIRGLSIFSHIPQLPGSTFSATPLISMTLGAVILAGVGLLGLRRRDLPVV